MNQGWARSTSRTAMARVLALLLASAAAATAPAPPPATSPLTTIGSASAPRGAVGEILFEYAGPALCASANQGETAPVLVRLARLEEPATLPGAARYRLSFLGSIAGDYDLLPLIEHCDGRKVADLAPIRVQVFTQLPESHDTDLYLDERPLPSLAGRYRLLMGTVVGLWLMVPLAILLRRLLRRVPPPEPVAPERRPTLADQLRPLVEAAMDQGLSIADQGRLELLLLRFWRSRLALEGLPPAEAIGRLRREPDAGRLLVAVEEWLHADRAASPTPKQDVAALLEPYRNAAAVIDDVESDAFNTPSEVRP